jgi:dihydroorotate dehydrogenase
MPASLRVRVGALELKNPIVCASGEHVISEAGVRAGLAAGAAVVVAKSTNESQAARTQLEQTDYAAFAPDWRRLPWQEGASANVLCRSGLQPRAAEEWLGAVARLDREARAQGAYVAASLILADLEHAVRLARHAQDLGLRLLEFNVGTPYADEATHGGVATERSAARLREQVAAVCGAVEMPVWVKLTGQSENVAALAQAARDGGAAAVIMIGRFLGMLPDLDTQAPALETNLGYGGPWALPLTCYWLARTRARLGPQFPLIGTNGARSGQDAARMLLAGASAVEFASAVLTGGFGTLAAAIAELQEYATTRGEDVQAMIGRAADRVTEYGGLPRRPEYWRDFVPAATLRSTGN